VALPHPRNVGEILDGSFRLTFRRFWLFAALAFIPNFVMLGDHFAALWTAAGVTGVRIDRLAPPEEPGLEMKVIMSGLVYAGFLLVSVIPLAWIYGGFLGALQTALAREATGERATLGAAVRSGFARPWSIGMVEFLLMTGMTCCCIPGLVFIANFWPAVPIIVFERSSWTSALSRSVDLTRGYRWRCLGIWLLMSLLPQIIVTPLVAPLSLEELIERSVRLPAWLSTLFLAMYGVGFVLSQIANVFARAAQVLFYLDLRARKEGIDLVPPGVEGALAG
jgi:hypothetical protein